MNVQTQHGAPRTQLGTLIKGFEVAMVTSIDTHGALVSRPMTALEMDSNGALWFFTQLHSAKTDQLAHVNVSFSSKSGATYVSISGHGEINLDRERIEHLWTPFARPWFPEGPGSANLALLRFVPASAEYWDAPHAKMARVLAMAASVVAGRPIGLGENETLDDLSAPPERVAPL